MISIFSKVVQKFSLEFYIYPNVWITYRINYFSGHSLDQEV